MLRLGPFTAKGSGSDIVPPLAAGLVVRIEVASGGELRRDIFDAAEHAT
jgi:hypothetical protein